MADPEPAPGSRAVFLSYANEDTEVALAVCETLRAAGVEVWMDHSELQGGDAWDAKIRRQIRECALFVPIISAKSQARREGYFRLEWRLAEERTQLLAHGTTLILPVVADATKQSEALVPPSFLAVQWVRLPGGAVPPALATRVRQLLGLETSSSTMVPSSLPLSTEPTVPLELMPAVRRRPAEKAKWLIPIAIALSILIVGVFAGRFLRPSPLPPAEPKPISRYVIDKGDNAGPGRGSAFAISQDGRWLAYTSGRGGPGGAFLRSLDAFESQLIPGTVDSIPSIWVLASSQDGRWLAIYKPADQSLMKIPVSGGSPVTIASDIQSVLGSLIWARNDTIYMGGTEGIRQVAASGGTPEVVLKSSEGEYLYPEQLLPDGERMLIRSLTLGVSSKLEVARLSDGSRTEILPGATSGRFLPELGYLVYALSDPGTNGNNLFGISVDPGTLLPRGGSVPLVGGVVSWSLSDDGTLAYTSATAFVALSNYNVVWVDRQGNEESVPIEPGPYINARLSPDGTKLVLFSIQGNSRGDPTGMYVWDFAAETRTWLNLGENEGGYPLWSPDGNSIYYASFDGRISVKPANNARPPQAVTPVISDGTSTVNPLSFTPDGEIVFWTAGTIRDIGVISPGQDAQPRWLFGDGVAQNSADLSPDGKWLAYSSSESGQLQVYVSPFPDVTGDRVQISNAGGVAPLWSRDGTELFYMSAATPVGGPTLMSASVRVEDGRLRLVSRTPLLGKNWLEAGYRNVTTFYRTFDLAPDNERFIVLKEVPEDLEAQAAFAEAAAQANSRIYVVENWTEELKQRLSESTTDR